MQGQAVDLGGGVFKQRLNRNMHSSIILTKGGERWIYDYLFAKNDQDNIEDDELTYFRKAAKLYEAMTDREFAALARVGDLSGSVALAGIEGSPGILFRPVRTETGTTPP